MVVENTIYTPSTSHDQVLQVRCTTPDIIVLFVLLIYVIYSRSPRPPLVSYLETSLA